MIEIKKLTKRYLSYVLSILCTDILDFNTSRFGRLITDWLIENMTSIPVMVPYGMSVGDNITPKY